MGKAAGDGKGVEIDRELLSLRSPVDSAFRGLSALLALGQRGDFGPSFFSPTGMAHGP